MHEALRWLIRLAQLFTVADHLVVRCISGLIPDGWILPVLQLTIDFKGHCDDANTPEFVAATVELGSVLIACTLKAFGATVSVRRSKVANWSVSGEEYEEKRGNGTAEDRKCQPPFQVRISSRFADQVNRGIGSIQKVYASGCIGRRNCIYRTRIQTALKSATCAGLGHWPDTSTRRIRASIKYF